MDADDDLTLGTTTSDGPGEAWLGRREQLMDLIHNLRVSAPLLHHRVLEDGGPGAIKFDDGCDLVVAGIPGALIVRLKAPSWCSTSESQRLAIIAAVSVGEELRAEWFAGHDASGSSRLMTRSVRGHSPECGPQRRV